MGLMWVAEPAARWDEEKAHVLADAPPAALGLGSPAAGSLLPGEWWRVVRDGEVVGYGWMDVTFGHGEVLLAVTPSARGQGVGAYIVDRLLDEAHERGLARISNIVRPEHPRREEVTGWLVAHGFERSHDDEQLVRAVR